MYKLRKPRRGTFTILWTIAEATMHAYMKNFQCIPQRGNTRISVSKPLLIALKINQINALVSQTAIWQNHTLVGTKEGGDGSYLGLPEGILATLLIKELGNEN